MKNALAFQGELVGGGGSLQVTTASGLTATFTASGARPAIGGIVDDSNDADDRTIVLAESSTVSGVDVNAGEVGVYGDRVSGITVVDNNISNMSIDAIAGPPLAGHAIHLHNDVSGTITGNQLTNNQGSGLHLTGNTGSGNAGGNTYP